MSSYDRLEGAPVLETVRRLEARIATRFPERNLRAVASQLAELLRELVDDTGSVRDRLRRTRWASAAAATVVLVATVVALALAAGDAVGDDGVSRTLDWLPLIESAINDVVFAGVALWFLWSIPERLQRRRVLALLHRLRSLAHVIDMHQLTKDPERLRRDFRRTAASPVLDLDAGGLEHYLDYCSEMLSLVGKAAALVAEESQDSVVLGTIADIEALTTGTTRKIWQKISVLNQMR